MFRLGFQNINSKVNYPMVKSVYEANSYLNLVRSNSTSYWWDNNALFVTVEGTMIYHYTEVTVPSGIEGLPSDGSFTIYPNPVKDFVRIECELGPQALSIVDILAALILKEKLKQRMNEIDRSKGVAGIYILELMNEKGNIRSKKIGKE